MSDLQDIAIPTVDVRPILAFRNSHPGFAAVEVDDPTDMGVGWTPGPTMTLFHPTLPPDAELDGWEYGFGDCGPSSCIKQVARKMPWFFPANMLRLPSGRVAMKGMFNNRQRWISMTPRVGDPQCGPGPNNVYWYQMAEKMLAITVGHGSFYASAGANPYQAFSGMCVPANGVSGPDYPRDATALRAMLDVADRENQMWVLGTGGRDPVIPNSWRNHYYGYVNTNPDGTLNFSNPVGSWYNVVATLEQALAAFQNQLDWGINMPRQ